MALEKPDELLQRTLEFVQNHKVAYLATGGTRGHLVDMSHVGVEALMPTLLLKTIGRKSGEERVVPLIYGVRNGEWVVIGSKGGAPEHPGWFLNLREQKKVQFQVATECFDAGWRLADGAERDELWDYMAKHFPPFNDYRASSGGREIPVVLLKPENPCSVFHP